MKTLKLLFFPILATVIMSSTTEQLDFNKPVVLTFKKLSGWSEWQSPVKGKAWKIESVWSSIHGNSPDYLIQINDAETRHKYNEDFKPFWLSNTDSLRLFKAHAEFDFAVSILEYNVAP